MELGTLNLGLFVLPAFLPALTLWLAYPRRAAAAWAGLTITVVCSAGLAFVAAPSQRPLAVFGGLWSVLGSVLALVSCLRGRRMYAQESAALDKAKTELDDVSKKLSSIKERWSKTDREQKEALTLYGTIKRLAEALSWEDMRPRLESAVVQYLGLEDFALYAVPVEARTSFEPVVVRNLHGSPGSSWATIERCLQEQGLAAGERHLLESPERALALPVTDQGEAIGYFYARIPKGADAQGLFAKAAAFCEDLAFAFRRIRLFQEMDTLSHIDGLTGVYRRGDFDERLREEVVRAQTFKVSCGLMILDIDHFKRLNDRYGHPFGDQVLRRLGEILRASVYETDFVARYGGEEFVVILPRADPLGARRKAEAIRQTVAAERFYAAFEPVSVTITIGLAHLPRDARSAEELVAQADRALYEGKAQGRDRVVDSEGIKR